MPEWEARGEADAEEHWPPEQGALTAVKPLKGRGSPLAFAQLLVHQELGGTVLAGQLEPLDYLGRSLLLLDLLRVVALLDRELVEPVDTGSYLLLMLQGLLKGVEWGAEGTRWLVDGQELHLLAAVQ